MPSSVKEKVIEYLMMHKYDHLKQLDWMGMTNLKDAEAQADGLWVEIFLLAAPDMNADILPKGLKEAVLEARKVGYYSPLASAEKNAWVNLYFSSNATFWGIKRFQE